MSCRLVLVDDHELAHAGMRMLCATRPGHEIVAGFQAAEPALEWLRRNSADVVVLDLELPDRDGVSTLAEIVAIGGPAVVILTGVGTPETLRACLDIGAAAIVSKGDPVQHTLDAIDSACAGKLYVSPSADEAVGRLDAPPIELPPRQLAILQLVAAGVSNKEISYRLDIAPPTVSFHLAQLRRRLGADNNRQLVDRARAARLVISSST